MFLTHNDKEFFYLDKCKEKNSYTLRKLQIMILL